MMNNSWLRTSMLLGAIAAGALLPEAHACNGLIRYFIALMMLSVFLQLHFSRDMFHSTHWRLLAANLAIAAGAWGTLRLAGEPELALAAFFIGITPTATAASVITGFLGGRVPYVIGAFLWTNLGVTLLMPVLLPVFLGASHPEGFGDSWLAILKSLLFVVAIPLAAAFLIRRCRPHWAQIAARMGMASFTLWAATIFLIVANASHFLRSQPDIPWERVGWIALTGVILCALNFAVGYRLGGRDYAPEASQSLGQKNTSLTIYLALAHADALTALGPTFYVLFHNLWNAWQLHRHDRRKQRNGPN